MAANLTTAPGGQRSCCVTVLDLSFWTLSRLLALAVYGSLPVRSNEYINWYVLCCSASVVTYLSQFSANAITIPRNGVYIF